MDFFTQRGSQAKQTSSPAMPVGNTPANLGGKHRHKSIVTLRLGLIVLLFSTTILLVALLIKLVVGGPQNESNFVNTDKYQAVFLNGGQVYFGHVSELNNKYLRIQDIYYLRVNQQVQPDQKKTTSSSNDVSLVKLGCELHGPEDAMTINREQIIFWENLKDDGQVAKAVASFKQQNPDGQKCDTASSSTPSTSNKQ